MMKKTIHQKNAEELALVVIAYHDFTDTVTNVPEEGTQERARWNSIAGGLRYDMMELASNILKNTPLFS